MAKFTKKFGHHKIGLPPGSLAHAEKKEQAVGISVYDYNEHELNKIALQDYQELDAFFRREDTVSWVNITGVHDVALVEKIGAEFDIHALFLEDIVNIGQRPKMDEGEDYIYVVLNMLDYHEKQDEVLSEQVSIIFGKHYILTFQQREGDVFDPVRKRLESGKGRIRKWDADYLAYTLIDVIVDKYFFILEQIGDKIEQLESDILEDASQETYQKISRMKKELIFIRKNIWPMRELLNNMMRHDVIVITRETKVFVKDAYDHVIQIMDNVETYRDVLANLLDLHMSSMSNRMNEVMKTLTIIATVFIPLTFLAGIYGMNFEYMPELGWHYSYPVLWGIMLLITGALFIFFKRRGWL